MVSAVDKNNHFPIVFAQLRLPIFCRKNTFDSVPDRLLFAEGPERRVPYRRRDAVTALLVLKVMAHVSFPHGSEERPVLEARRVHCKVVHVVQDVSREHAREERAVQRGARAGHLVEECDHGECQKGWEHESEGIARQLVVQAVEQKVHRDDLLPERCGEESFHVKVEHVPGDRGGIY